MKRFVPFLLLAGACAPDITPNPPTPETVVVEFDPAGAPPVVPSPNDLARTNGRIVVPASPTDTPAQTEFNLSYLGSLSGFPFESTAQVFLSGPVDPATVIPQNFVVLDVTARTPVSGLPPPVFDPIKNAIDLGPPAGGWTRAHQYAIALIAGQGRLTGANHERVIGSPTWALVSSPSPLVSCQRETGGEPDLTSPCTPAVDVIPSTLTDPAARLKDQTQKAIQLEQIRQGYAPLLAQIVAIEGLPNARTIPILWTFTIVDAGEVTFDPANGIIPFPNDVLRANGNVALPNPITGKPLTAADCAAAADAMTQLVCGLNTLDGFSTIAPPISENGAATDAVAQAHLDPTTSALTTASIGLIRLGSSAPAAEQTTPVYSPCLNCLSSPRADGTPQTSPQQLQWQLTAPLDERTTYLAYVTGQVKDDAGKNVVANPAFALVRSKSPIYANGKSQVNVVTDAQAAQLEPLRSALQPALDGLEAAGVPRATLALAWAFTTQTEATALDQLYAYGSSGVLPMPAQGVLVFADATAQYTAAASATSPPVPIGAIGAFYVGLFETPVAVTGLGGTLDVLHPKPEPVTFALAVPAAAPPAGGYPITIFGHGFTRDHNDFLAIAGSLAAAGQATIATDVLFHGERSSCTGFGAAQAVMVSDDVACADLPTMKCNEDPLVGRCVARDPAKRIACPGLGGAASPDPTGNLGCEAAKMGACVAADGKCEGGDFKRDAGGRPVISGWNIFSLSNFFSTRDNFRQQVIDLAQLVQTLRFTGPTSLTARIAAAGGAATFDLTQIGYVGQSLSGILGTLFNAVSPDTNHVVLNVPGGDLPQIVLSSPSFAPQKAALLNELAAQSILPGTPAFDQFIGTAQWILDPADPTNMGWRLTHPATVSGGVTAPNANRKAFIQFIADDQTVPNLATFALLSAADRPFSNTPPNFGCLPPLFCYEFTDAVDGFDMMSAPPDGRHGFLLKPPAATTQSIALTIKAQTQAATFLATGTLP
ncbi:MAG TPA: hypothetical protein VN894_16040 [Polyangiaceae bacterium]|nr:hypothetical protein [Polyangiaceae bacterium]